MARNRARLTGKGKSGKHYQVPKNLYDTPAFRSLSLIAFKLFHNLLEQYNGANNGKICAVDSQLKLLGWAESSFRKAMNELIEKGFMVRNFQGGIGPSGKKPSRYRFTHLQATDAQEFDCPSTGPTNDFLKWTPE